MNPRQKQGSSNAASCIVATLFLVFILIIFLIILFSVLRAKKPTIAVSVVQVPSIHTDLVTGTIYNFTLSIYFSLNNPNRAAFDVYDSSVELLYYGRQIAFMFIPAGKVMAGKTQVMCTTLAARPFPLLVVPNFTAINAILQVNSRIKMAGRVSLVYFFTHHVEAQADCENNIALSDGAVLSFRCTP